MDYSHYNIREFSSDDHEDHLETLEELTLITADPFLGPLPHEVFAETALKVLQSGIVYEQFYLENPEQKIVASFRILFKKGTGKSYNLIITNVHTHKDFRKQGFADYLIQEVINKYEISGYKFKSKNSDDEGIEKFLARHLFVDKYEYYWTLYSAVGEFYKRHFGFHPFYEMHWLKFDLSDKSFELIDTSDIETFTDKNNFDDLFANPKYLSFVNLNDDQKLRSTELSDYTLLGFIQRDKDISEHYKIGKDMTFGGRITHKDGKESFIVFTGDLGYTSLVIHKLFTNVDSEQGIAKDLQKLTKLSIDAMDSFNLHGKGLLVATQDIHTPDQKTYDIVSNQLQKSGWKLDTDHKILPMMKDFGQKGVDKDTKWINNGFWTFS